MTRGGVAFLRARASSDFGTEALWIFVQKRRNSKLGQGKRGVKGRLVPGAARLAVKPWLRPRRDVTEPQPVTRGRATLLLCSGARHHQIITHRAITLSLSLKLVTHLETRARLKSPVPNPDI